MRYLIAGLGNPGSAYYKTRHNIGFESVERTAEKLGVKIGKNKFLSLCGEVFWSGEKLLIMKPQTFMNVSGEAVREASEFYSIPAERIVVIHDELDLELGVIKISRGGGAAGHNGVKSVMNSLGSREFTRIRMGVGKPPQGIRGSDYVLSKFTVAEKNSVGKMIETSVAATLEVISGGVDSAMNIYNGQLN